MKFIITESQKMKIFMDIYNFIEDIYDLEGHELHGEEYTGEEGIIRFYTNDYKVHFTIYLPEYWNKDTEGGLEAFNNSPLLVIDKDNSEILTNLFGLRWIEPMKKFIKDNFNIEIRAIES